MRWHVAQMLCRCRLSRSEQGAAVEILLDYLKDRSRIVKTFALQALSDLARVDESLKDMVTGLLEAALRTGSPAVRSRARKLLEKA